VFRWWRLPLFPLIDARERLTRVSRLREPEPMVMGEAHGVAEYDRAGSSTPLLAVHQFNALAISGLLPNGGMLLDLGCGSARLLVGLARGRPDAHVIGLDLSEPMLEAGRQLLAGEGLSSRVELRRADITDFDRDLPPRVDAVSCNLALHHLLDTDSVDRCLRAIRRARDRSGCAVYIFDLARLRNPRTWPAMTSLAKVPGPAFRRDSLASERAAFTFAELTDLLERSGLRGMQHARAGPLGEWQLHWLTGRGGGSPGRWHDVPVPGRGARLVTRLIWQSFPTDLLRGDSQRRIPGRL
jgi:SAM-dependent methyltransferase